jgi:hypothetical protein
MKSSNLSIYMAGPVEKPAADSLTRRRSVGVRAFSKMAGTNWFASALAPLIRGYIALASILMLVGVWNVAGIAPFPFSGTDTNTASLFNQAANFHTIAVQSAHIQDLQGRIQRLELGFVVLATLAGSALTALSLLAMRDLVVRRSSPNQPSTPARGAGDSQELAQAGHAVKTANR